MTSWAWSQSWFIWGQLAEVDAKTCLTVCEKINYAPMFDERQEESVWPWVLFSSHLQPELALTLPHLKPFDRSFYNIFKNIFNSDFIYFIICIIVKLYNLLIQLQYIPTNSVLYLGLWFGSAFMFFNKCCFTFTCKTAIHKEKDRASNAM